MRKNNIINLLGFQEKLVKKVERSENYINIYLETKKSLHLCPSCGYSTKHVHDYKKQKIQHVNIGKTPSFLILNKRRYACNHCGKRFYESYDFIQRYFRKSNEVYENVIADLKCLKNYTNIAKDNHVSIPTVVRYSKYFTFLSCKNVIYHLPKRIGIDEFKGNCNRTKYQVHIFDLDTGKTIDIVESRKYDDLEKYFSKFEKRNSVELVTMDLYSPFKRVIKDKFINAKIVADRFHYTRIVMKSLDELRLNLWRNTKGIEKKYFKYLKLSLMKKSSNAKDYDAEKLLYAFELSPILKEAYKLKEQFLNIKDLTSYEEQEKAFRKWIYDADCSTIKEFKSAVKTLRQWHEYISNSFKYNISNGPVEGKNNLIKVLKRISFGFRNLDNFRIRILMCEL
ncbi:Transposase [compost metagenome]